MDKSSRIGCLLLSVSILATHAPCHSRTPTHDTAGDDDAAEKGVRGEEKEKAAACARYAGRSSQARPSQRQRTVVLPTRLRPRPTHASAPTSHSSAPTSHSSAPTSHPRPRPRPTLVCALVPPSRLHPRLTPRIETHIPISVHTLRRPDDSAPASSSSPQARSDTPHRPARVGKPSKSTALNARPFRECASRQRAHGRARRRPPSMPASIDAHRPRPFTRTSRIDAGAASTLNKRAHLHAGRRCLRRVSEESAHPRRRGTGASALTRTRRTRINADSSHPHVVLYADACLRYRRSSTARRYSSRAGGM
ncbi:hypothetical protein PLICRDRAFT_181134 [Plicaturopsis crispa FD-325 SS-3]|uniref:Uncharacterized protein n=1 Tax=Plicaturopsis crispa FD-325 SS-3 TaxID=944288 RepID=A0A0C9T3Q5_PLICR|nr:hypothetical protein PLICRDRAFT_181134 [Plicaturopsis crispa FD-325 SS-3]